MTAYSYQLYSSRNFPPLVATLAMLAETGYASVEGYGALFAGEAAVAALEKALDKAGLTMPTAHVGLDAVKADPAGVIAGARRLGIETVFVPYLPPDARPHDAQGWRAFAHDLSEVGLPLVDAGLSFGWHNHDYEFQTLPTGETVIELILGAGDHVDLEFDVAWAVVAGADPSVWIERYGSRIRAAHIKDIAPAGQNRDEDGWADVGHGTLDWRALLGPLKDAGVGSFVVEHDNPSDDRRFAARSLAALRALDDTPSAHQS